MDKSCLVPSHYIYTNGDQVRWHLCAALGHNDFKEHSCPHNMSILKYILFFIPSAFSGIILCMHPAKERWRYSVTPFVIGWAQQRHPVSIMSGSMHPAPPASTQHSPQKITLNWNSHLIELHITWGNPDRTYHHSILFFPACILFSTQCYTICLETVTQTRKKHNTEVSGL